MIPIAFTLSGSPALLDAVADEAASAHPDLATTRPEPETLSCEILMPTVPSADARLRTSLSHGETLISAAEHATEGTDESIEFAIDGAYIGSVDQGHANKLLGLEFLPLWRAQLDTPSA